MRKGVQACRRAVVLLFCTSALPHVRTLEGQQRFVDVEAYHFRVNIPDTGSTITGLASVLFNATAGYDDTLRLDLVGMSVRRVFDIHTLRQLPIAYDGRMLKIVTRGSAARRPRGVVVEYSGAPSAGLVFANNARGRRSVFADNYPDRARYWLPVIDHPSDKARVLWSIQIPRGWTGIANQPECRPGARPPRCNESAPIPTYTMVLGATQMTRSIHRPLIRGRDTIPMEVWAYPEDSAAADNGPFRRITEITEVLQRMVGPFPYAKLSHVQSVTRFGAMENATAIFYNDGRIAQNRLNESTVRHEIAHQWFGDAVTPREFSHVWLSEGFAVYFSMVSGAALDGDSVLATGMRTAAQRVMAADSLHGRPVVDTTITDPDQLNAITYQKGAWVLHMLRGQIGDSAFFRGIRNYYRTYRDSSVHTVQFQRVMERASGDTLGWFWRQWLRQPGFPRLDIGWRNADRSVVLNIRQAQPEAWGRYRIPAVPVLLVLGDGRVLRRAFSLNERYGEQTHTFMLNPGEGTVSEVVVDPDGSLLMAATVTRTP